MFADAKMNHRNQIVLLLTEESDGGFSFPFIASDLILVPVLAVLDVPTQVVIARSSDEIDYNASSSVDETDCFEEKAISALVPSPLLESSRTSLFGSRFTTSIT